MYHQHKKGILHAESSLSHIAKMPYSVMGYLSSEVKYNWDMSLDFNLCDAA